MSLPCAPINYGVCSPRWKKQVECTSAVRKQQDNIPLGINTTSTMSCKSSYTLSSTRKRIQNNVSLPQLQQAETDSFDVGSRIFGEYIVTKRLGRGSFGAVFEAVYGPTGTCVAIKTASTALPVQQLKRESAAYAHCHAAAQKMNIRVNIPKLHWAGPCKSRHIMILELLGKDIESLSSIDQGRLLPEQELSKIACKMFAVIRSLHCNTSCLHGDIKPANFSLKGTDVFLLDLGFARLWKDNNNNHVEYSKSEDRFIGTPRFASSFIHDGIQLSRRDDLISFCYTLIYLLRGSLPWASLKSNKEIRDCKSALSSFQLTNGHTYLSHFYEHVSTLRFSEEPDYDLLNNLLVDWSVGLQKSVPIIKEILPPILTDNHQFQQQPHSLRRVLTGKPSPPPVPRNANSFNPHSHRFNTHRHLVNGLMRVGVSHCDPSLPPHPSPPAALRVLPSTYIATAQGVQ